MVKNIGMVRGDTFAFGFELYEKSGDEVIPSTMELTEAYFSCKRSKDSNEYAFQKTYGNGISHVSDNVYRVRIAPEDTENLAPGKYSYDLQINPSTDVFTILEGVLEIRKGTTE